MTNNQVNFKWLLEQNAVPFEMIEVKYTDKSFRNLKVHKFSGYVSQFTFYPLRPNQNGRYSQTIFAIHFLVFWPPFSDEFSIHMLVLNFFFHSNFRLICYQEAS